FAWMELEATEDVWTQVLLEVGSGFNVDPRSPGVRADKWRQGLSVTQIREFERIAGAELEALGYDRVGSRGNWEKSHGVAWGIREGARRGRRTAQAAAHPRAVARAAASRLYERQSRRAIRTKHGIVERFERMLSEGRVQEARSLLAPDVQVRI